MSRFRQLRVNQLEKFLEDFSKPGSLKYRKNKWVGLNRNGEPFTVHVMHVSSKKYSHKLVEAIAKDLDVSRKEFDLWYRKK